MDYRIYVASSWRNPEQPDIVRLLRDRARCTVYDFRNPPNGSAFQWAETINGYPDNPAALRTTLKEDQRAIEGFNSDMRALRACDLCVLVMPAGISANLELGYAAGIGKTTIVYTPEYPDNSFEPELMWNMADYICITQEELFGTVTALKFSHAPFSRVLEPQP